MKPSQPQPVLPWWRVRMVWFMLAGPALAVVASFITLALAIHGRDTPLLHDRGAAEAAAESSAAHTPALQARNHAVTPRH